MGGPTGATNTIASSLGVAKNTATVAPAATSPAKAKVSELPRYPLPPPSTDIVYGRDPLLGTANTGVDTTVGTKPLGSFNLVELSEFRNESSDTASTKPLESFNLVSLSDFRDESLGAVSTASSDLSTQSLGSFNLVSLSDFRGGVTAEDLAAYADGSKTLSSKDYQEICLKDKSYSKDLGLCSTEVAFKYLRPSEFARIDGVVAKNTASARAIKFAIAQHAYDVLDKNVNGNRTDRNVAKFIASRISRPEDLEAVTQRLMTPEGREEFHKKYPPISNENNKKPIEPKEAPILPFAANTSGSDAKAPNKVGDRHAKRIDEAHLERKSRLLAALEDQKDEYGTAIARLRTH